MKRYLFFFFVIILSQLSCTHSKIRRYQSILEPKIGNSKKAEIDKIFGEPISCQVGDEGQVCEYRTSAGMNDPVPDALRKTATMGPDLSPYDRFDVLNLRYDANATLLNWEPVVLAPQ